MHRNRSEPVLVTGATGYVGGRLVPQLLEAGYRVRVVRSLSKLKSRPWAVNPLVETAQADVLDFDAFAKAVERPIVQGPDRFAPRRSYVCNYDPNSP